MDIINGSSVSFISNCLQCCLLLNTFVSVVFCIAAELGCNSVYVYGMCLPGTLAYPHYKFIKWKSLVWGVRLPACPFTHFPCTRSQLLATLLTSSPVIIAYLSLKWLYKWFTSVFKTPLMCFSFADANKSGLVFFFTTSLSVSGWPSLCMYASRHRAR